MIDNRRLDNIVDIIKQVTPDEIETTVIYNGNTSNEEHVTFIGKLIGFLNYYKFAHWCAQSMDEHKTIDDFYKILSDYIDLIGEILQGINEQFKMEDLTVIPVSNNKANIKEILNELKQLIQNFCDEYSDDTEYIGALDASSTFLAEISKYFYLFRLLK